MHRPNWNINCLFHLTQLFYSVGENQPCIEACQDYIKQCQDVNDDNTLIGVDIIHVTMGRAYMCLQKSVEAEQAFKAALQRDQNFPMALIPLGKALVANGKFDEAIQVLKRAAQHDDMALHSLGQALIMNHQYTEAIQVLERFVQIDPTEALAQFALGYAHHHAGNKDAAINQTQLLLNLDPTLRMRLLEITMHVPEGWFQKQEEDTKKEFQRRDELLKPTQQFASATKDFPRLKTPFGEILELELDSKIEKQGLELLRNYEATYQNNPKSGGNIEAIADHLLNMGLLYFQSYTASMFQADPARVDSRYAYIVAQSGRHAQECCRCLARSFELYNEPHTAWYLAEAFKEAKFYGTALFWLKKAEEVATTDSNSKALQEAQTRQSELRSEGNISDPLLLSNNSANVFPTKDTVGLRLELQAEAEAKVRQAEAQVRQAEAERKRQEEQQHRVSLGLCVNCGKTLGFMDKLAKRQAHTNC